MARGRLAGELRHVTFRIGRSEHTASLTSELSEGGIDEQHYLLRRLVSDEVRRQRLYDGQLFVHLSRPSILGFTAFARSMIEDRSADVIQEQRSTRWRSGVMPTYLEN